VVFRSAFIPTAALLMPAVLAKSAFAPIALFSSSNGVIDQCIEPGGTVIDAAGVTGECVGAGARILAIGRQQQCVDAGRGIEGAANIVLKGSDSCSSMLEPLTLFCIALTRSPVKLPVVLVKRASTPAAVFLGAAGVAKKNSGAGGRIVVPVLLTRAFEPGCRVCRNQHYRQQELLANGRGPCIIPRQSEPPHRILDRLRIKPPH